MRRIQPIVANNGFSHIPNRVDEIDAADEDARLWMQPRLDEQNLRLLDANQLTSLNAMISYVAYQSGATEFRVERKLADHFNVPSTKCLPAKAFDPALRYLVDSIQD